MYNSMLKAFSRKDRGSIFIYNILSTLLTIFELFWTLAILNNIINKKIDMPKLEVVDYRGFEGIHGHDIAYQNEKTTKLQGLLDERFS